MIRMVSESNLCGLSCAYSLKNGIESADVYVFAVERDASYEAQVLCAVGNSINTSFILNPTLAVSRIAAARNGPEIAYSVVGYNTIYMIYLIRREFPVFIKPRKPMGVVSFAKNTKTQIAFWIYRTEYCAKPSVCGCFYAGKNACFWIILCVFFELFLRDHAGTLVKAVEWVAAPLTRWFSGCIPSRCAHFIISQASRQCL